MGKNMEHEMAIGFVTGLIEIEGRLRNLVIPSVLSYLGMLRAQIHENVALISMDEIRTLP